MARPAPGHKVNLDVPRSSTLLIILAQCSVDIAALVASIGIAFLTRWLLSPLAPKLYLELLPLVLLYPVAFSWAGLYPGYGLGPVELLRRMQRSLTFVSLLLLASTFLFRSGSVVSRFIVILSWCLMLAFVPLARAGFQALVSHKSWWGRPVLILGAAKTAELIVRRLRQNPGLGLRPIGSLDDDAKTHGLQCGGVPIIGALSRAPQLAQEYKLTHVIVAMPGLSRRRLTQVVEEYTRPFSHVSLVPDLLGLSSLWVSTHDMQGILGLQLQQQLLSRWSRFLKRLMDLALSVPAIVLLGPFILILGGLVKVFSPGPAFYAQAREGLNGRIIRVWKIRTMVVNADDALKKHLAENPEAQVEWDHYMKLRQDPRIVPVVGKVLRRLSLDELPQLWNIVRGDMSLVGPRPFPEYHLERFSQSFRTLRHRVPPGLTGLWQVSARSEGDLGIQEELDTYYIRNWSLWLDIYLLARTITAVFRGAGAY